MKMVSRVKALRVMAVLMLMFVLTMFLLSMFNGCTENSRVKNFGGTGNINLPQGEKLVLITWKEENIWYLTRKMRQDETAEVYKFEEESSLGIVEGTYIIHESK